MYLYIWATNLGWSQMVQKWEREYKQVSVEVGEVMERREIREVTADYLSEGLF